VASKVSRKMAGTDLRDLPRCRLGVFSVEWLRSPHQFCWRES